MFGNYGKRLYLEYGSEQRVWQVPTRKEERERERDREGGDTYTVLCGQTNGSRTQSRSKRAEKKLPSKS